MGVVAVRQGLLCVLWLLDRFCDGIVALGQVL
jgi:hypothetical protein